MKIILRDESYAGFNTHAIEFNGKVPNSILEKTVLKELYEYILSKSDFTVFSFDIKLGRWYGCDKIYSFFIDKNRNKFMYFSNRGWRDVFRNKKSIINL